ncbi:MAG: acyl-CoA carboxylase subunit epsilon [Rhodococcus sp.]|nr:acyl-CoA carboxylase subunit epsilon [Rhodococcus sp. (in: high G+C Gram-positive bacteria)]
MVDPSVISNFEVAVITAEGAQPVVPSREAPQIRIVKGSPTDPEVAAIVAVIAASAAPAVDASKSTRPYELWGDPAVLIRGVRNGVSLSPGAFANNARRRF